MFLSAKVLCLYVLYLLRDVRGLVTVRVGIFSSTPLVIVSRLFFSFVQVSHYMFW